MLVQSGTLKRGDIILAEVLQGFRSDPDFEAARQAGVQKVIFASTGQTVLNYLS